MIEFANKVAAAFKEASKTAKIEIAVAVAAVLAVVALVF